MFFASDNASGAAPEIMDALSRANAGHAAGYGADDWSRRVETRLSEIFERDVACFLVSTGTAANAIALSAYAKPGGIVLCHEDSHVMVDECGATDLLSGANRLLPFGGTNGKLRPGDIQAKLDTFFGHGVHTGRAVALTVTNLNEYGQAYTVDEVSALSDIAKSNGMAVHMDGARFANMIVSLGVHPAEITWKAGVDVLTLGGTKNGCWCAEAIVVFDPGRTEDLPYLRKRSGHLISKGRFLGAQMDAYLTDDLWLNLARKSNAAARRLATGLSASNKVRLLVQPDGNQLFAVWSQEVDNHLKSSGAQFYPWDGGSFDPSLVPADGECIARLVTSFDTTDQQVDDFLSSLATA